MPTKKKRVGFIPRSDVIKLINKLSIENNLSNSKIVSILVEEALSVRGIFNKKTGKITNLNKNSKENLLDLSEYSVDIKDNEKLTINPKLSNNINLDNINLSREIDQETIDLQTYKKFISFLKFQEMISELNT